LLVAREISVGNLRLIHLAADHFANNADVIGHSYTVRSSFYAPPDISCNKAETYAIPIHFMRLLFVRDTWRCTNLFWL